MSVRFEIDEEGNVKNAVVVKPMEDAVKQTAETLRLIKTMKFIPRTINGKAIKSTILLPVNF
jgi:TonB family protein